MSYLLHLHTISLLPNLRPSPLPGLTPGIRATIPWHGALDPASHSHFTRLQRSQGVMEPNVKSTFEQILLHLDSIDERCGWIEKGAADGERDRVERDTTMGSASTSWRKVLAAQSTATATTVAHDQAQEEQEAAIDSCLTALDQFASTHSQATILADIRAQDFEQRVIEMELWIGDLELIRIHEIRDERDDMVLALESTAEAYEEWRLYIKGSIEDVR